MKFTSVALIASTLLSVASPSVAVPNHRGGFGNFRHNSRSVTAAAAASTDAAVCSAGATATVTKIVTVGAGGIPAGIGGGNGGGAQETASTSAADTAAAVTTTAKAAQGTTKATQATTKAAQGTTKAAQATTKAAQTKTRTRNRGGRPVVTTVATTVVREAPFTATVTVTRGGQVITTKVATTISSVETQVVTVTVTEGAEATDAATATATASDAASTTDAQAEATGTATGTASENATASGTTSAAASTNTSDSQTTLKLDPRNVMKSLESNGNPGAGEIPSLTSSNNFINHCLLINKPLTNGQQVKTGSCNTAPMGRLLAKAKLPSSTFQNPPNFAQIPANTAFNIEMTVRNMVTGNFVNAQANYYIAPAQTDASGTVIAHTHVVLQKLDSFDQKTVLDPLTFTFFKGLNDPAKGGVVSTSVDGGVPAGFYRMASINSAANHQPVLSSIEEHGSLDAFSYFQAV